MNLNELSGTNNSDGCTYALVHEQEDWAEIVSAFGEFDLSVAGDLQTTIDRHMRSRLPLVLDLEYCDYLDSTILRVFVRTARGSRHRLGIVVPPGARVRRIFEMTQLDSALPVHANREEARRWFEPSQLTG